MKINILIVTCLIITGCESLPTKLHPEELGKFSSINDLIDRRLFKSKIIFYGEYANKEILEPYSFSRDYCQYLGGKMIRIRENRHPLFKPHPEYLYGQEKAKRNIELINESHGEFYCTKGESPIFGIDILNNGTNATSDNSVYSTIVVITAYSAYELAQKEKKIAELEKEEEQAETKRKKEIQQQKNAEFQLMRSNRGIKICQTSSNGLYILVGYTEDSASDKIKISIAKALLKSMPIYQINDFQPTTIWDYPSNWYVCYR